MKHRKTAKQKRPFSKLRILGLIAAGFAGLALLVVACIYLWPLTDARLQAQAHTDLTYEQAMSTLTAHAAADSNDPDIKADCRTRALLHDKKQAKSVVLFHGYTACPGQYDGLAETLFEAGYNVYIPRAPKHGFTGGQRITVPAADLITYANESVSIAKALGEESGVIGLSGGGVLATWTALYRTDAVKRALILSPFYEPAQKLAPKWQIKPLLTLAGQFGLLHINDGELGTYQGLSQYLIIAKNYSKTPSYIPAAVVVSPGDTLIDHTLAAGLSGRTLPRRALYSTPAEWGFGHDIADKDELKDFSQQAYEDYVKAYESKQPAYLNTSVPY